MVRIINDAPDDLKRKDRFRKMTDITYKMVGEQHVSVDNGLYVLHVHNSKVLVFSTLDVIHVNNSDQIDLATDLAKKYEEAFGGEYTVKQKY